MIKLSKEKFHQVIEVLTELYNDCEEEIEIYPTEDEIEFIIKDSYDNIDSVSINSDSTIKCNYIRPNQVVYDQPLAEISYKSIVDWVQLLTKLSGEKGISGKMYKYWSRKTTFLLNFYK